MTDPHVHECKECTVTWDEDVIAVAVSADGDHGLSSEWPFTHRCLVCGYVGWPNTRDVAVSGRRYVGWEECPRESCSSRYRNKDTRQEMIRNRIDSYVETKK